MIEASSRSGPSGEGSAPPPVSTGIVVPFFDLAAQHATLAGALDDAMRAVVHSGRCILGPAVESFEAEFARHVGARHAVAVGSGTDALLLSLKALDLPAGSEVVTSPFTFAATASSIVHAGLVPVFADIDPESWCLSPEATESVLSPKTSTLLPVHLFGAVSEMDALCGLAAAKGLRVVEDAAQACGSRHGKSHAGTLGDAGCFSFYPTKNLGAAGDAGMVVTDDVRIAHRIRLLRGHGDAGRFEHVELGGTHRMDALQAAILRVKLPHLDTWLRDRETIADLYRGALAGTDFVLPVATPGRTWNQFCVRHPRRDAVRDHLRARGIASDVYYPLPLHLQKCFAFLGHRRGDFPVAEALAGEILALPLYPGMSNDHSQRVVEALREFDPPRRRSPG